MAFLYAKVEEYLAQKIASGELKPGQKISNEMELASQFQVSRQTIRTAIASLTEKGLLYAIRGNGTFVADPTQTAPRHYMIGFAMISFKSYNLYPKILEGVSRHTNDKGYSLVLGETKNNVEAERACLNDFLSKSVDAMLIDPALAALPNINQDLYDQFIEQGKPLLMYNGHHRSEKMSYVVADDRLGGYLATKHLLDYGHRDICAIFEADDTRGFDRYHGFAQAFREYGLPVPCANIDWYASAYLNKLMEKKDGEYECCVFDIELMEKIHRCTAMVAYNDLVASRVLHLLDHMHMRCPDDFSIVSFDDTELTKFANVPVTSIAHPSYAIGDLAGKVIIELLDDPTRVIQKKVPVSLTIRESTRRLF